MTPAPSANFSPPSHRAPLAPSFGRFRIVSRWSARLLLGAFAGFVHLVGAPDAELDNHRGAQLFGWEALASWSQTASNQTEITLVSPEIVPAFEWDELVASWNAETPAGSGLRIEARPLAEGRATRFRVLGLWSSDPARHPRESVRGQQDEDGEVLTDTLALKRPWPRAQLRCTLVKGENGVAPRLTWIGVSVIQTRAAPPPLPPTRAAWGKTLPVPERSQVSYPGGETAWCSPTCVSMVLAYWAGQLGRPELDRDVPEVVQGVQDPVWGGTGNWPFNTAFAGALPRMRAYVARLTDISELEDWVLAGVPVVVSLSYDILRGKPQREAGDGHLVVCVGFTAEGDPVVNDPGTRLNVRKTFPRANLAAAWAHSHQTVYIVLPRERLPPADRFGHWHGGGAKP